MRWHALSNFHFSSFLQGPVFDLIRLLYMQNIFTPLFGSVLSFAYSIPLRFNLVSLLFNLSLFESLLFHMVSHHISFCFMQSSAHLISSYLSSIVTSCHLIDFSLHYLLARPFVCSSCLPSLSVYFKPLLHKLQAMHLMSLLVSMGSRFVLKFVCFVIADRSSHCSTFCPPL